MNELTPTFLHESLTFSAKRWPDKPALICGSQTITYQQLDEKSNSLAQSLTDLTLTPQDRVIIFLDNSIETVISLYGILKVGGVFVVLSPLIKSGKLAYIIDNAEAAVLISHTAKGRVVLDALEKARTKPKTIWVHSNKSLPEPILRATAGLHWDDLMQRRPNSPPQPRLQDQDLAALIYTSGSTGQPKGVMSPHASMLAAAGSIIQYLKNTPDDIILNVLPLSFDYGLYQVLMSILFGGTVVLEKSFLYIHEILQKIQTCQVTGFPIVPTIVAMLLNMQDLGKYDFSSLRYITNTGAAFPVSHIKRLREMFPDINIYSMFGLTECKRVCYLPPEQIDIRPDSVGKAMPNCATSILDPDDRPITPGQIGELVIEGPNVMAGYWRDPELTAKTYRTDPETGTRRLYSGDYFKEDSEGYLYFLGRKDDMIKTRGERVSPKEIENSLSQMPAVAEIAVIGVPDETLGQAPKAFIVKDRTGTITETDVMKYAAANMESFMVPKYVEFLDSLPKTPNGKIDKKELKKREKEIS